MERKRKLPPRAAARHENASKKRNTPTPDTPAPPTPKEPSPPPVEEEVVPDEPELPTSIQPGNPLPTVDKAQSQDLPNGDFQSIQESGVLAESLTRSRQKWVHEGIFQKYWSKPTKRKGVVKEEPNNPAKDTMTKIGQITITVEPHVFDAVLYAIKDPKAPAPTTKSTFRPVMQYGPPNGVMPPPPKPKAKPKASPAASKSTPTPPMQAPASSPTSTPTRPPPSTPASIPAGPGPALAPSSASTPNPIPPSNSSPAFTPPDSRMSQNPMQYPAIKQKPLNPPGTQWPPGPTVTHTAPPSKGLDSVLAAPRQSPVPPTPNSQTATPLANPALAHPGPPTQAPASMAPAMKTPSTPKFAPAPPQPRPQSEPQPSQSSGTSGDPVIMRLAERAGTDPYLRDLMRRVAVKEATPEELAHFQTIISSLTAQLAEQRNATLRGPSAEELVVDGRTVKYFANEVHSILEIILNSNPQQRSTDLRTPPGSDPLVILLVKKALDDKATKELVQRVAQGPIRPNDSTELKNILDKLKGTLGKEKGKAATPSSANRPGPSNTTQGGTQRKSSVSSAQNSNAAPPQQALRSKGPPPSLKPDIAGLVLEFPGGTGDRYLFPKYSILEYPQNSPELIASFLIVRKGSDSEYGGDPKLDYYQPITIRINSPSGKHLENFMKIVAPQDEVRRYMDDIMSTMTRAEYILLAMRLPRNEKDDSGDKQVSDRTKSEDNQPQQLMPPQGVLWAAKPSVATPPQKAAPKALGEEEQYQSFIASVS